MRNGNGTERCLTDKCTVVVVVRLLPCIHLTHTHTHTHALIHTHKHAHTHTHTRTYTHSRTCGWKKREKTGVKKLKFEVKEIIFFASMQIYEWDKEA